MTAGSEAALLASGIPKRQSILYDVGPFFRETEYSQILRFSHYIRISMILGLKTRDMNKINYLKAEALSTLFLLTITVAELFP